MRGQRRQFRTLQELRSTFADYGETAAIVAFAGKTREEWSFAKLADISGKAAQGLIERGVGRGEPVALLAPNSAQWIVAFWAIIASGAVAVPLDSQTKDDDLNRLLTTVGCRWILASSVIASRALPPQCQVTVLDGEGEGRPEHWEALLHASSLKPLPSPAPNDDAVIVFTSGTTGTPKAVPLTNANLLTNVVALGATGLVGPGDRALLPLPLYHAYPLTIGMLTPLALGCGVILPSGISGPELVEAMREGKATALLGVPRLYTALLDNIRRNIATRPRTVARLLAGLLRLAGWAKKRGINWPGKILLRPLRRALSPDLRLLVSGGAPIKVEVERALSAMGWEMLTGYGLVETSSMLTFNPPGAALAGSAGKLVPGMEIRIANPGDDGIGEIEARGPSLFAGYRGDAAKTREAFTEDGWFRTGDLGTIDGKGYLHIAGRKSETIVLADGKKLFPEEFEALYAATPLIREIALLGRDGALAALVVPDLAAARDFGAFRLEEMIREGLANKARLLPSYARPSGFAIAHEALPRTQLGKIRRHMLPPIYEAALEHKPAEQTELRAEDRAFLDQPDVKKVWLWLKQRFPEADLRLDTIPQIDLAIDSLGWVELTLALERDLGIVLKESEIARIVSVRDLLRLAAAAQESGEGSRSIVDKATWLDPLGPLLGGARAIGEVLIRIAMRYAFRLSVEGSASLPLSDPMLLCPNHVSYLDPFALGAALPRERLKRTCWGGWTGVAFTSRLRRLFSRAARIIPIDPDRAAASGLAMGSMALQRGWNLVWFPEGARSVDGQLQRFLPGVGALIARHPVPVVPVYIDGTYLAWPVGRKLPRLHKVTVRFGKPLDPVASLDTGTGPGHDAAVAVAIRSAVADLARATMTKP